LQSNPEFSAQVAAAAADGKAAIIACEAGGTTAASTSFPTGKPSRSLKAAWRILYNKTLPPERVLHLEGGVLAWYRAGLPMTGEYDPSQAFNTPNAAGGSDGPPAN
jgi:rhodanese-related sulfurtransferase